jgi:hypothetical protein
MREEQLKQQLLEYASHGADAAVQPAAGDIRRRARRHSRRMAALSVTGVVLVAGLGVGLGLGLPGGGGTPTVTRPNPPATSPGTSPTRPPVTTSSTSTTTTTPPTSTTAATRPTPNVVVRPDGLGVVEFGATQQQALSRLRAKLGKPDETGSWNGATPFGTCPGDTRAVRWGRLYVLFTNGPTRYGPDGTWHLFTYQVDAIQRTAVDPQYAGPTPPPDPPPLRGYSPKTPAGIGFGSTLAELRAAYGRRVSTSFGEPGLIHRFRVRFGATGELFGSLSGGTPAATITGLAAGARCGE